ncbi:hypothetical protein JCM33374_g2819 [Metschnikowia sp. JCM 33374]|nr:hypothetical protein JCM33374_g2819 [Metschnikowia sp. JCM 33374]
MAQKKESDFEALGAIETLSSGQDDSWEDGREPTELEMSTLRHVSEKIPLRCWYIAVIELAERFTYYGLSAPFQNYAQYSPQDSPKGVLDLKNHDATAISYFWQFWCFASSVIGAYIADSFLGKFATVCWFSGIYAVGILILFVTSLPSVGNYHVKFGGFLSGIIIIGLGTGGIKANITTLIADQISSHKPKIKTLKSGEKVIEDPSITIQNVFMIFYLMINIGSLSVFATSSLELYVGYWAAYLLPLCFFAIVPIFLYLGRNVYVKVPVRERVISKAFRCFFIALRNRFDFNAAKPSFHPEAEFPWDDKFVDEVNRAVHACKVFLFFPIFWLLYGQMISNFVSQAGQMESRGIPNDMLQAVNSISIIVLIPICEYLLYPLIRRFTPFRAITRIFWGFTVASAALVYAAIVQHFIYKAGPCYNFPKACAPEFRTVPNNINVAIQIPCYVIIAMSEILASVTGLEYAYTKAPATMKSFIMALFMLTIAAGSALGIALAPTSKDPKLVWTYSGLAISCFLAGGAFYFCFRHYNDKEKEWNKLDHTD